MGQCDFYEAVAEKPWSQSCLGSQTPRSHLGSNGRASVLWVSASVSAWKVITGSQHEHQYNVCADWLLNIHCNAYGKPPFLFFGGREQRCNWLTPSLFISCFVYLFHVYSSEWMRLLLTNVCTCMQFSSINWLTGCEWQVNTLRPQSTTFTVAAMQRV